MQLVLAHWKDILLAISAVDVCLISIFPQVPLFVKIKDFLAGLVK